MKRSVLYAIPILLMATTVCAGNIPFGGRIGYTIDPDQVHIGFHAKMAEPLPNVTFLPNIELGSGDNLTTITFNGEFVYNFTEMATTDWEFYAGGGPAMNYYDYDGGSSTDFGLNALAGFIKKMTSGHEFFLEGKLGLEDSPDFKITAGVTFF